MELAFGTGVTSLATMCGALSTACRHLQKEGVPRSSVLHGFRVAEDICVDVLRELSVRTTHIEQEYQGCQGHEARVLVDESKKVVGEAGRQKNRDDTRSPVSVSMLAHLAAGFQHCAGCEHAAVTDQEKVSRTLDILWGDTWLWPAGFPKVSGSWCLLDIDTRLRRC